MHRVYERLCNFQRKYRLTEERNQLEMGLRLTKNHTSADTSHLEERIKEINYELSTFDSNKSLISVSDIHEMLLHLNQKTNRKEVEEMVWEVDEDLDNHISWNDFRLMYNRNLTDRTGLEPSKLFHLVQFLIYDKNENNRVSVDETMHMLYAR